MILIWSGSRHSFDKLKIKNLSFIIYRWHIGFCNDKYTPCARGFDTFYGYFNAQNDYYDHRVAG